MSYEKPVRNRNVLVVCQGGTKLAIPIPREVASPIFIGTIISVAEERCSVLPLGGSSEQISCKSNSDNPVSGNIVLVIYQSGDWFCHLLSKE